MKVVPKGENGKTRETMRIDNAVKNEEKEDIK